MGGLWGGVLFDNPAMWMAPSFSWAFIFRFAEVIRDRGQAAPTLTVEWVRLRAASWQDMVGQHASCPKWAQPIEASISFFDHHRYDRVDLQVLRQKGRLLQVVAEVEGDVDGLGIPALRASSRLLFDGITVALSNPPPDVEAARAMLNDFTDTEGLEGYARADHYWFSPKA